MQIRLSIYYWRFALVLALVLGVLAGANLAAQATTSLSLPDDPTTAALANNAWSLNANVHTRPSLVLPVMTARPGDTIMAGLHLVMDAGWHTYWQNPGDSGEATTVHWDLPPGVTADPIQWPLPHKLTVATVTTYAYEDEVVLLVPLHLATNLPPGPLNLTAHLTWLECQNVCLPQKANVTASLTVGNDTVPSHDAPLIQQWQGQLPREDGAFQFTATWDGPADGDTRAFTISARPMGQPQPSVTQGEFFPLAADNFDVPANTQLNVLPSGDFVLHKTVKKFSGDWPTQFSGLVTYTRHGQTHGCNVILALAATTPLGPTAASQDVSASPLTSLGWVLLSAFLGGMILNLMPCVLPVIALKILGFVNEAGSAPRRVRALGGVYTLGVLMSFLVLAGVVIGLKSAGRLVGWGVQFSSPAFLVGLTTLVTLVALNLFGLFEIVLGDGAADAAGRLVARRGWAGAFFNGMLATALATPCTAPFLGSALGFAFAQPAAIILLVFLAAGLGLAAPYLVLSWNPAWLKILPKPGAWMEKFKVAMGFPVLASALWLFTLAADNLPKVGVLRFGLFLIALAFAAWIWGAFVQRGTRRRGVAAIVSLLLVLGAATYAWMPAPEVIAWQPWSTDAVAHARAEGHPVLVDFTADWCLTCQVNKKTSLEAPSVRAKLSELGVVPLVGDYTHSPDDITRELNRYYRAGVPLVLVFPADSTRAAEVLPEVLTPQTVLDALQSAR